MHVCVAATASIHSMSGASNRIWVVISMRQHNPHQKVNLVVCKHCSAAAGCSASICTSTLHGIHPISAGVIHNARQLRHCLGGV
jgi:hypothetical protein